MTEAEMRAFIAARVMSRLSRPGERRNEALREVLSVTMPGLDDAAISGMASTAPEIPSELYCKWVGQFADRMLETVPPEQLRELCDNTQDNNATLLLLYSMFMESERMEKMVADDLQALNKETRAAEAGSTPFTSH